MRAVLPTYDLSSTGDFEIKQPPIVEAPLETVLAGELLLAKQLNGIRQFFSDILMQRFLIQPPKDLLNRWFMVLVQNNFDFKSLLETADDLPHNVLGRELLLSIPYRLQADYSTTDIKRVLQVSQDFHARLRDFLSHEEVRARKLNTGFAELTQLRNEVLKYTPDRVLEQNRAKTLPLQQAALQKYNLKRFAAEIKEVLQLLVAEAERCFAQQLNTQITDGDFEVFVQDDRRISIPLTGVEQSQAQQFTLQIKTKMTGNHSLVYAEFFAALSQFDVQFTINRQHLLKLQQLLANNGVSSEFHLTAITALLRRYGSFFGNQFGARPNQFEGTSFHAAATEALFKRLNTFGCGLECFASPLNCYFGRFCSAFPALERRFGSQGSFFDVEFVRGVFECNPPFTEELIDRTVEKLLKVCREPKELVFVLLVPDWRVPLADYHAVLESEANADVVFKKMELKPYEHCYVSGDQQKSQRRYYNTPHGSCIYVIASSIARESMGIEKLESIAKNAADAMRQPTGDIM